MQFSKELLKLVSRAVAAQTREHNDRRGYSSEGSVNAVQEQAKKEGYTAIRWPGLYPEVRTTDGHWHTVTRH